MTLFLKIDFSCLFLGGLGKYDSIKKVSTKLGIVPFFKKIGNSNIFGGLFGHLIFVFCFLIFAFKRKKQFGREV
jgi:hypothetical protein